MTNHQKAFKEAEKELEKDKINEIKGIMKSLLQEIQKQKEVKTDAEDALRLLKLDMDDLRAGKIDKIKERHDKSKKARQVSPLKEAQLNDLTYYGGNSTLTVAGNSAMVYTSGTANWADATSGTYAINCSNGTTKEINL